MSKGKSQKSLQLQLRISPEEKATVKRIAKRHGMDLSKWVLRKILPPLQAEFQEILEELCRAKEATHCYAALNDLFCEVTKNEFREMVAEHPEVKLNAEQANYVCAMIERAAQQKKVEPPTWTATIPPASKPIFGSGLKSLRLHLLVSSPPSFRKRNIFIDSSIGDRV